MLAVTQTGIAVDALRTTATAAGIALDVELVEIRTIGDRVTDRPYAAIGPKGVFAAELQEALLRGEVDIAVHSLKDLPAGEPHGLEILCVPPRADAADVLVSRDGRPLTGLPSGARVGTSSARRAALVRIARPDVSCVPIRGNVDTRLRKVQDGEYDAILLAAAGLERLGRLDAATERFDPRVFPPAPGQGALAVEARSHRADLAWLRGADDPATRAATDAERAFMRTLEGGCEVPLGAWAEAGDRAVTLHGFVAAPDGTDHLTGSRTGMEPDEVGVGLARDLERRGARELVLRARPR